MNMYTHGEITELRESTLAHLESLQPKECLTEYALYEHIGMMYPNVVPGTETAHQTKRQIEHLFAVEFVDSFLRTDGEQLSLESFTTLTQLAEMYDIVTEESRIGKAARGVARKAENGSRAVVHGVRGLGRESKRVKVIAAKIPASFDNLVKSTFGKIKDMDSNERRQRILEGSYRFKIYKIIRNGILVGAGWAVAPALTAIGIIVMVARDKKLDGRARTQLLQELESELAIVKEKIRDAEQKGDNSKKYQLMRIQDRLTNDLNRIKYHLKGDRQPANRNGGVR